MNNFLLAVFLAIGGMGLVFGILGKYAPEYTVKALVWLFAKFPKIKQFVHDNLKAIEDFEDAELAAIKKAEESA